MKPYGIVAYPEAQVYHWQGKIVENGDYYRSPDQDMVKDERDFPRAMFFTTEVAQLAEMEYLAKQFPKVLFCPFEIKSGIQFQVQPNPKKFEISVKGKLPL